KGGREYVEGCKKCREEGERILANIYAGRKMQEHLDQFFIQLPANNMSEAATEQMLAQIDSNIFPDVLRELQEASGAGEPVNRIIDRLRNNSNLNIPILYLDILQETICRQLGEARCRDAVIEDVNEGYMERDERNIVPEILLTREQIGKWRRLLEAFKDAGVGVQGQLGRKKLVDALMTEIGNVLQYDIPNSDEILSRFARGLPNSSRSKLMQYSDTELRSTTQVPTCEFGYLTQYASKMFDVLDIVYGSNGRYLADILEGQSPPGNCVNISDKGKRIPFIKSAQPHSLNTVGQPTDYKVLYGSGGNEEFFWIPVNYLP